MKKIKTTLVKGGNDPIKTTKKAVSSDDLKASSTRKKSDHGTSYNQTNVYHNQPVRKPLTSDAAVPLSTIRKREQMIKAAGPKNKPK